jgi:hypothetical protein
VAGHAAVGVNDDLAAGQAGVAHRAADLEAAGRVDQQAVALGVDLQAGEHRVDHVLLDVRREHLLEVDLGRVLGGDHHGVEPDRTVTVVFDRDLGLAVGAQIRNGAVLADLRQALGEAVCQLDRQRHQLGRLAAGVAEHQALVAGALTVELVDALALTGLVGVVDALGDVGRLRTDGHRHATGGSVEALVGGVVTDLEDLFPDETGDIDVGLRRHLSGDVDLTSGDQRLDGDTALGITLEHGVENRVTDLVGDLVRVALCDRLGGEKATGQVSGSSCSGCWRLGALASTGHQ